MRQVLGFKFRTGDWQHYLEDLEIFEGRVTSWEKTSGDLLSDSIMQALVKEGTHEKLRQQVETTTFTNFRELKRTLVSHCLTEISRLPEGGGINYFQKGGKQQSKGDGKYGKQQKGKDMKGKSKGKTEKGWKGKGAAKSSDKPAYFDGACSGCGKWGHKKKDCWGEKSKMQVNAVASSGASSAAGTSTVGGGSSSGGGVYAITEHARSSPPVPTDPEDGWILMMSGKAEKWTISSEGATRGLVDSGAWTMVCPEAFASGFPKTGSGNGTLKSCSGTVVKQYGTVRVPVKLFDRDGVALQVTITFVVADVDQVILSVYAFSTLGFSTVLGAEGHLQYGERKFNMVKDSRFFYLPMFVQGSESGGLICPIGGESGGGAAATAAEENDGREVFSAPEQRDAKAVKIPKAPNDETRLKHNLTHVPFADWCDICVRSRARDDPHKKQHGKEEQAEPEVSMDYFNLGLNYNMQFPALAVIDHCTGALMATGIRCKGADKFTVKAVCEFLGFLGYPRMSLKSDGESSIQTLVEAVISRMHTEENVKRISPTTSPVGSHQSNGMAEVGVQLAEAVARTFTLAVEQRYGVEVKPTSSILPWAVRHAAYVYTRFQVRRNGKTPYEDLTMKKFTSPMVEFGEIVHGREQGERQHNLKIIWKTGVWLGRAVDTGDHLLGCPDGVYKARAVRRMADEKDRWDRTVFDQMIWLPWATNVSELNLVGEEWTPTASCRACEGGAKAGHNKRCNDRRTEWAKIRQHTAALQASSGSGPDLRTHTGGT